MNMQTTAGSRAIATQDDAIAANVAKTEEVKRRPSAIDAMAARLEMSPGNLKSTLMNTVFKGATDSEFAALIVVSQAYRLNPLLKEIFAFPAKGGGIIPVVSVDGWIRITNEHPQFDGIEFNDIVDEAGHLYAIESVIYRRDRSRPIKVTEYMDECKGTGPAWQKTPKRMLRHRALIQGARVAFGFSGIYAEDEGDVVVMQDGGEIARNVTPPTRAEIARAEPAYDAETGEITEDDARQLDAQGFAAMEGRDETDHPGTMIADAYAAKLPTTAIVGDVIAIEQDFARHRDAMLDADVERVETAIAAAKARLKGARA